MNIKVYFIIAITISVVISTLLNILILRVFSEMATKELAKIGERFISMVEKLTL